MKAHQQGFTLIEVMVAIMLMAVVSLMAWRGLDSVTRADAHLQASSEQTEALLRALNQLERDVVMRASVELSEPITPDADARSAQAPPALTVRSAEGKGFRLDVIRTSASGNGQLQRVRWWLKGDTLYRAIAPARSHFPLPAPKHGIAVLDQISVTALRVWDADKGWRQLSGNHAENPVGIEISITRKTDLGSERYRQVMGPLQ